MTLNGEMNVALFFKIILNHNSAVLLAIADFLVSSLHTAVVHILSVSSPLLLVLTNQWVIW